MSPNQAVISINLVINPVAGVSATFPKPFMSNNFLNIGAFGGVTVSGNTAIFTHKVRIDVAMLGGVRVGGSARLLYGGHYAMTGKGGVVVGAPSLSVSYTKAYQGSSGIKIGGKATMTTFSPVIKGEIATILPVIDADISVVANTVATITTTLPKISVGMYGGKYEIKAKLPVVAASIAAVNGSVAELSANLPLPKASLVAVAGYTADVKAKLTLIESDLTSKTGYISTIDAKVPLITTDITAIVGNSAVIETSLPAILAQIEAGYGAVGTISAKLTSITSAITVLAQATKQELLLVLGTKNNAISTYDNYPYNSFCELNGVYYGAGPNGLSKIGIASDLDDSTKINAGLSTGLMQFGEPHLKRITDAYMTLRTAGDLTLTVTVDEGVPVILTMPAQQLATLIQRRVVVPKGLHGKSWKFEIKTWQAQILILGILGLM